MSVFFRKRGKAASLVNYVEYIQSDGNQWIDSGFVPNQDTRIVAEVINYTSNSVFGVRASSSSKQFCFTTSGGYYRTDYNTQVTKLTATVTDRFTIDKNKNVTTINGTTTTHTYAAFTCPGNLYIFAMNNNGAVYDYSTVGICSMQIYDNDVLVRDFWPCYDPDGIACLYDKVEKKYYYNQGSGEFTATIIANAAYTTD